MKKSIVQRGITNVKYVVGSQLVYYALSFMTSFVLPGVLGVKPNGYYQVYVLYNTYIGMLHFGFNDGIYLKYGSCGYDDLPRGLFRAFMRFYSLMTGAEIAVLLVLICFERDPNKRFAFLFAVLNIFVVNASKMFNNINQVTDRMKIYSFVVVAENTLILAAVAVLIITHRINFEAVIACDFSAKVVVLIVNVYKDRELVFGKCMSLRRALPDCLDNISVGMKLMIANFMGMLVMGLGRIILERFGAVEQFSRYSFAVSSINLAMVFISSVSLVLYPILCRLDRSLLPKCFVFINQMLCCVIFCMMLIYYPLMWAIRVFLPKYVSVLDYLYLLFPIVIMQSKTQLLINTYYKSLREEKAMLKANVFSVVMFLLIAVPLFYFIPSVKVIVWATLITFTWRCYASEIYLKRKMKLSKWRNIPEELIIAAAFLVGTGIVKGVIGAGIYLAAVAGYFFLHRGEIFSDSKKILRSLRA